VVEGEKLLAVALDAGAEIEAVFVAAERFDDRPVGDLVERAGRAGARTHVLAPGVLERVADTVTPQPVMAVVRAPKFALADLSSAQFVVVCIEVRDPGNAGAVIRAADAAGADAVVCCEGTVDPLNPKTVRASAGSVLRLPVVSGGQPTSVLSEIGRVGLARLGAVAHGGVPFTEAPLSGALALVLGNESAGLSEDTSDHLDGFVTIPMAGGTESLNVAMAATVLCFEVARRRSASLHEMRAV
jgi:TrmH family RNA methyltransferase